MHHTHGRSCASRPRRHAPPSTAQSLGRCVRGDRRPTTRRARPTGAVVGRHDRCRAVPAACPAGASTYTVGRVQRAGSGCDEIVRGAGWDPAQGGPAPLPALPMHKPVHLHVLPPCTMHVRVHARARVLELQAVRPT